MSEKKKILIVDDEPVNQRIIEEILGDLVDYKIASSGEEALKIIESFSPDLVLLDIMMPGIDGYEVCKQIKRNPKLEFTKVIFVSHKEASDGQLKDCGVNSDSYMMKPFIPEDLLVKVKGCLEL